MDDPNRARRPSIPSTTSYDVVVLGGGLAGLTLAIHLRQTLNLSILVAERNAFPAPEAAFKVGESVSEIGSWYLAQTLGLRDHLLAEQIRKQGLRFFMPGEDNSRIETRLEMGPRSFLFTTSYQLDRGRLENELARRARDLGVEILDGAKVMDWTVGTPHEVAVGGGADQSGVRARWVVDATGRRGYIRKRLGLTTDLGHECNAVWWRIKDALRVDEWVAPHLGPGGDRNPVHREWIRRVPGRERWRSTNHLLGPGYWVWLIPLSSGSTSVGIVADARALPMEQIGSFDKTLTWLDRNEPQLASDMRGREHLLQDFRRLGRLAYGATRVFSPDRWAMTGEAGGFLDPLYSPGTDFIALGNHFIVDLIEADLHRPSEFPDRVERANQAYLQHFHRALPTWRDVYPLMGSGPLWSVKVVWDTLLYFSFIALSFIGAGSYDVRFLDATHPLWVTLGRLNDRVQRSLIDAVATGEWDDRRPGFLDLSADVIREYNSWLTAALDHGELTARLQRSLALLEAFSGWIHDELLASPPSRGRPTSPGTPVHERLASFMSEMLEI